MGEDTWFAQVAREEEEEELELQEWEARDAFVPLSPLDCAVQWWLRALKWPGAWTNHLVCV